MLVCERERERAGACVHFGACVSLSVRAFRACACACVCVRELLGVRERERACILGRRCVRQTTRGTRRCSRGRWSRASAARTTRPAPKSVPVPGPPPALAPHRRRVCRPCSAIVRALSVIVRTLSIRFRTLGVIVRTLSIRFRTLGVIVCTLIIIGSHVALLWSVLRMRRSRACSAAVGRSPCGGPCSKGFVR